MKDLRDQAIHLTGVKGTGVAALAEILVGEGARVSGSDGAETYYTDELLARVAVVPQVGFAAEHVPHDATLLIYSAAYGPENPERREAERRGIPQMSYAEALGSFSRDRLSMAVSGVHGKTSVTAMAGTLVTGSGLPVTVVAGSAVPSFGGSATLREGDRLLIAETCEYRRHFLEFTPDVLLLTSVESDHQDYYPTLEEILSAFEEFGGNLRQEGALVYCHDDAGAREIARRVGTSRRDISLVPYGFTAPEPWRCTSRRIESSAQVFTLLGPDGRDEPWRLPVPGRHMVANAAGALAALTEMIRRYAPEPGNPVLPSTQWRRRLATFRGTRRRSEVVAETAGITIIDDYAHHPTAIAGTLAGFREFYPGRRIVVDFMSHTWSRTAALLDDFGPALAPADMVVLNDIYASAREENHTGLTGEILFQAVAATHPRVVYQPDFEKAARFLVRTLRAGDVFVTMGAGDNFRIGRRVQALLTEQSDEGGARA